MKTKKNQKQNSKTIKKELLLKDLILTTLKQGKQSKKIISCSFFATKNSYRNFDIYVKNLKKFLEQKNILKGFETRIYVDDSSKNEVLNITKDDDNVTLIEFLYKPLKESYGHIGMFGTFMRFLPLFEKNLDCVFISDIDIPNNYLPTQNLFNSIQKAKAKFHYKTYVCYNVIKSYGKPFTILAGTIISYLQLPITLFNKFIKSLVKPNKHLQAIIEKLNKENSVHPANPKPYSKIPYGIDEVFTNTLIYNYLVEHNITTHIDVDYGYMYRVLRILGIDVSKQVQSDYYKNPNKTNFLEMKKKFIEKLPLVVHKNPCIKYMYDHMDMFKDSFVIPVIKKGKELL